MEKNTVTVGQQIDVFSIGGYHKYKVIEVNGDEVKLLSLTNPSKTLKLSKADIESGRHK